MSSDPEETSLPIYISAVIALLVFLLLLLALLTLCCCCCCCCLRRKHHGSFPVIHSTHAQKERRAVSTTKCACSTNCVGTTGPQTALDANTSNGSHSLTAQLELGSDPLYEMIPGEIGDVPPRNIDQTLQNGAIREEQQHQVITDEGTGSLPDLNRPDSSQVNDVAGLSRYDTVQVYDNVTSEHRTTSSSEKANEATYSHLSYNLDPSHHTETAWKIQGNKHYKARESCMGNIAECDTCINEDGSCTSQIDAEPMYSGLECGSTVQPSQSSTEPVYSVVNKEMKRNGGHLQAPLHAATVQPSQSSTEPVYSVVNKAMKRNGGHLQAPLHATTVQPSQSSAEPVYSVVDKAMKRKSGHLQAPIYAESISGDPAKGNENAVEKCELSSQLENPHGPKH